MMSKLVIGFMLICSEITTTCPEMRGSGEGISKDDDRKSELKSLGVDFIDPKMVMADGLKRAEDVDSVIKLLPENTEWLSLGGTFREPYDLKAIPRLSKIKILILGPPGPSYDALKELAKLSELDALHMDDHDFERSHLPVIKSLASLSIIRCRHVGVEQLRELAARLPNLSYLNLSQTSVKDHDLAGVDKFSKLKELDIGFSQIVDCSSLQSSRFPSLKSLVLSGCPIQDASIRNLASLKDHLERLDLSWTKISDIGITTINLNLRNIKDLDLNRTNLSDSCLKDLADLPFLEKLSLADTRIIGKGFARSRKFECLSNLNLNGSGISDDGAWCIKEHCKKLSVLNLDNTRISDTGLLDLAEIDQIKELSVFHTSVSVIGVQAFRDKRPGVRLLGAVKQ